MLAILCITKGVIALILMLTEQTRANNQPSQPGFTYEDLFSSLYDYHNYDVTWHDGKYIILYEQIDIRVLVP